MSVKLFGIVNVTPDSFSDGGKYLQAARAIQHAEDLLRDGADYVDIGAESTNPKSKAMTSSEEWTRLQPVVSYLGRKYPDKISIDSYHSDTAARALDCGAVFINDITMFRDQKMVDVALQFPDSQIIVSHLSPTATSISDAHKHTPTHDEATVKMELMRKRDQLIARGIAPTRIILDPGIGFGKTSVDDWALNKALLAFASKVRGIPVMIGYSKKRFLGEHRMDIESNLAAARIAIDAGAEYLRVHDVRDHRALIESLQISPV